LALSNTGSPTPQFGETLTATSAMIAASRSKLRTLTVEPGAPRNACQHCATSSSSLSHVSHAHIASASCHAGDMGLAGPVDAPSAATSTNQPNRWLWASSFVGS
jgi:hypothetical protein